MATNNGRNAPVNTLQAIQPTVAVKLEADEQVYGEYKAFRGGNVDAFKNKGAGIGTSIAGIGVGVGGGTSVASKKFQVVATGQLLLTNKRIIFVGESFIQIPYTGIHVINFKKASLGTKTKWQQLWAKTKGNPFAQYSVPTFGKAIMLNVLYDGGLDNEQYLIAGKNTGDIENTYRTISQ